MFSTKSVSSFILSESVIRSISNYSERILHELLSAEKLFHSAQNFQLTKYCLQTLKLYKLLQPKIVHARTTSPPTNHLSAQTLPTKKLPNYKTFSERKLSTSHELFPTSIFRKLLRVKYNRQKLLQLQTYFTPKTSQSKLFCSRQTFRLKYYFSTQLSPVEKIVPTTKKSSRNLPTHANFRRSPNPNSPHKIFHPTQTFFQLKYFSIHQKVFTRCKLSNPHDKHPLKLLCVNYSKLAANFLSRK